jgi:hypothetical protein
MPSPAQGHPAALSTRSRRPAIQVICAQCITPRSSENERGELSLLRRSSTVLAVACAGPDGLWQTFFVNQFLHFGCSGTKDQGWTSSGLQLDTSLFQACHPSLLQEAFHLGRIEKVQPLAATSSDQGFGNVKNTDIRLSNRHARLLATICYLTEGWGDASRMTERHPAATR